MTRLKQDSRHPKRRVEKPASGFKLKTRNFFRKNPPINIVNTVLTILLHVAMVFLVIYSYQYYGLSKVTFICALGILVCLLIINNVLLIVGNNYHDKVIRVISLVFSSLLLIASAYGAITMYRLSSSVNKMLENSGKEQYETISVVYVSTNASDSKISDINGKLVGVLYETGVGTSSLGKEKLDKENITYDTVQCSTINDLFYGLIEGTIDVAIMPGSYRQIYENDSDYDYTDYLAMLNDFGAFEEKVLVDENENADKDLTSEPFNILLIGFAQNDATSSYGLADTIIVATVNPQTMVVSLTSIPRDSFVPISCYGGAKDKINAARGTSRACLMETVSNLLDEDIDFYMEVNFEAVVDIVDALDGILIDSPISFVGQSSSYTRGEMIVYVEEGPHYALGEEVLAFARERHAMPNGDFDRQQHQQEVIKEIARELIGLRDVNKALKVMEACGDNISTNLSMNQLTGIFNHIITAPNYENLDTFSLIDIHNMRLYGYSSWHYNETLELPVWIYKLYEESVDNITTLMNEYVDVFKKIKQSNHYYFFANSCDVNTVEYKTNFKEEQVHEVLPLYCPYLTTMTYAQALTWAENNGVNLNVTFVTSGYSDSDIGMVVDQGTKYGKKLAQGETVNVKVYGIDETKCIPDFVGKDYAVAIAWAKEHGYTITLEEVTDGIKDKGGTVISQTPSYGAMIDKYNTLVIKHYAYSTINVTSLIGKTKDEVTSWAKTYMIYPDSINWVNVITADEKQVGKVITATFSSGATSRSNDKTLTIQIGIKATNYELKFVSDPSGIGTITVDGATPVSKYSNANKITIATTVPQGYTFVGWYIDSKEISTEVSFKYQMEKNVTITAKFEKIPSYTVTVASGGNGSVSYAGEASVLKGTVITITANPGDNYKFKQWSDGNKDNPRTITVKENVNLTAEFEEKAKYTITVAVNDAAMGSVEASPTGEQYEGTSVTITATATNGYHFVKWNDGVTDASRTVTVTGNVTYTAEFAVDAPPPETPPDPPEE